jgi:murein DD-endopeptidase MepM/ murein hydrolase activator NlpD
MVGILFYNARSLFTDINMSETLRENEVLMRRLDSLKIALRYAHDEFEHYIAQDNKQRTFLQMSYIHPDIWSMGIGGNNATPSREDLSYHTNRVLNEIYESIDVLRGKLYLRKTSLDDIDKKIERSRYLWAHIPSIHPVPGKALGSGYGYRVDPIDRKTVKMHWGLDIGAPRGTKIVATADGLVSDIGWHSGYGLTLVIDHGFGFETRYGHCQRVHVKEGDSVKRGDVVATVGNTGRSIAPHLHYEVQVSGMRVNPKPYIDLSDVVVD